MIQENGLSVFGNTYNEGDVCNFKDSKGILSQRNET